MQNGPRDDAKLPLRTCGHAEVINGEQALELRAVRPDEWQGQQGGHGGQGGKEAKGIGKGETSGTVRKEIAGERVKEGEISLRVSRGITWTEMAGHRV